MKLTLQRSAIATATSLLMACGGGGDSLTDSSTSGSLRDGDVITIEVHSGSVTKEFPPLPPYRQPLYAVHHPRGYYPFSDDTPDPLIPFAIPDVSKSADASGAPAPTVEQQMSFYRAMAEHYARLYGEGKKQTVVGEIDDLDGDIATLYADHQRSGLSLDEYLAFYDGLDQHPTFAAQENAEGEMRRFFDDVNDELQGIACATIVSRLGWSVENPPCDESGMKSSLAREPIQQAMLFNALRTLGKTQDDLFNSVVARGHGFRELASIYLAWRTTHPASSHSESLRGFLADYLSDTAIPPSPAQAKSTTANQCASLSVPNFLAPKVVSVTLLDKNRIFTEADGAWTCYVSVDDIDPTHYAGFTLARSEPLTYTFKKSNVVLGQVRIAERLHYDGMSPASPHKYLPLITADVDQLSHKPLVKLSAHMVVQPSIVSYKRGVPTRGVWMETTVSQTGLGLLNAPAISTRRHFNSVLGFSN